ncbi:MAG: DUF1992 domain-containing protein [Deltaproteobacteria bacterium]|nr:DUF1992 domain-containing protein [Deltaproteobacteria bacterium]
MTQRKSWDLSFDSWIDAQIREAKSRGLFDELSGAGKPQTNLRDAEDPMWWAKQFLRRKEVSYLPPAIEVKVRAQKLREVLAGFPSERAVREAVDALNADIRRVNRTATDGPMTTQAPLDVEELVTRWSAARSEASGAAAPGSATLHLEAREGDGSTRAKRRALFEIKPTKR